MGAIEKPKKASTEKLPKGSKNLPVGATRWATKVQMGRGGTFELKTDGGRALAWLTVKIETEADREADSHQAGPAIQVRTQKPSQSDRSQSRKFAQGWTRRYLRLTP